MNAIFNMPPKFLAVFSNREKILLLSLSQPIRRSTMFRWRYTSRSNSTGRALRSSFSFDGMTGVIPSSRMYSSIQSARYPLSPPRATGQATRSPSPFRRWESTPSRTVSNTVDSCVWPGVRWKCNGCPNPSQRLWIFVDKPPLEPPNAWSSGSSVSLFFHPHPHHEQREQWSHRYTTNRCRSRRYRQTLPEGVAGFRLACRRNSIYRTISRRFAMDQTLLASHARANRFSESRICPQQQRANNGTAFGGPRGVAGG